MGTGKDIPRGGVRGCKGGSTLWGCNRLQRRQMERRRGQRKVRKQVTKADGTNVATQYH